MLHSVTSIGNYAFHGCKFDTITVSWQMPIAISSSVFEYYNTKLIVLPCTAALYRSAATWRFFQIEESNSIENISFDDPIISTQYYNLQGAAVKYPQAGHIYIVRETRQSGKVTVSKVMEAGN